MLLLHFDTGVADDLAPLFHFGADNTAAIFWRAAQHVIAQSGKAGAVLLRLEFRVLHDLGPFRDFRLHVGGKLLRRSR